jgi:hypothetical protein
LLERAGATVFFFPFLPSSANLSFFYEEAAPAYNLIGIIASAVTLASAEIFLTIPNF